jgi:hypothetical protein
MENLRLHAVIHAIVENQGHGACVREHRFEAGSVSSTTPPGATSLRRPRRLPLGNARAFPRIPPVAGLRWDGATVGWAPGRMAPR